MAIAPKTESPLSGDVMFYKSPEPLDSVRHANLGLNGSATPFAIARHAHAIPLIVAEFVPTSLNYPIIFAGKDYQPLAVTSIRLNENLFVNEDGSYAQGVYVPSFVRRYPFVLANGAPDEQLVVCIDRGADIIAENAEVPFFVDGQPSDFTKSCIDFCSSFEQERRKTDEFVKTLRELDLFIGREVSFTPRNPDNSLGQPVKITDYYTPSEEKVNALSDAKLGELARNGALQQIYAHWSSLNNWERLINQTIATGSLPTMPTAGNA